MDVNRSTFNIDHMRRRVGIIWHNDCRKMIHLMIWFFGKMVIACPINIVQLFDQRVLLAMANIILLVGAIDWA